MSTLISKSRPSDRVVLITGAGSGIGRATAWTFAHDGARVIVSDIDETGCAESCG